jgi:hypothetical protein
MLCVLASTSALIAVSALKFGWIGLTSDLVCDSDGRRELARQLHGDVACAKKKKFFFFSAPHCVKGEPLSGGWIPHMDFPSRPPRRKIARFVIDDG